MSVFSESDLLAISKAFENVGKFMSETELAEILKKCNIPIMEHYNADTSYRLFESLKKKQSQDRHRRSVLAFLRVAMNPERYEGALEPYKIRRQKLNRARRFRAAGASSPDARRAASGQPRGRAR